ncbi:MAG: glycosyltransferase family 4 protein [Candidatus Solibacter usitatus]|nr:glycosyltransferase family 4 protein [Candidatus Solibacter usitatus]
MLKIVIDVRRIRDFGIGTYIRNLVHALAHVDSTNRYVLVTSPGEARVFAGLPAHFEVAPYAGNDQRPLDNLAFPWFLRRFSADLYHIPLNRVPACMPRPYIVTIHDMSSLLFAEQTGLRADLHRWRFRRGLQRAACVIAVSASTRRDVQNYLGIPAERVRLVYSAPDPDFFRHGHAADARAAGPQTEERERQRVMERYQIHYPFLLYAGNIRPQKNIPRLVEAFAVAQNELATHPVYKDLRLIIIGDEIARNPAVRRAMLHSRVENRARFLGFVPFDTLRVFYESAAAFVFPSLYEGFGLPPLEAMAAGTPVITSNVGSLPEAVGDAAMLVNPENVFDIARGIREVLLDAELRATLVRRGRERVARFSWERTAREVLEIYQDAGGR